MADTGNGATLVLSGGFTASYTEIGGTEQEIPKIKTSHLGTLVKETYIPGDLYEPGEFDAELQSMIDDTPPPIGTVQTATITYPNGATLAGTGFIVKRKGPVLKNNELQLSTYTFAWNGLTGPTLTDSTTTTPAP